MSIARLNTDVALFKRSRTKVPNVNDDKEFSPEDVTSIHERLDFPEPPSPSPSTKEDPGDDGRLKVGELVMLLAGVVGLVFLCGKLFVFLSQ